jgi:hypothetical protein
MHPKCAKKKQGSLLLQAVQPRRILRFPLYSPNSFDFTQPSNPLLKFPIASTVSIPKIQKRRLNQKRRMRTELKGNDSGTSLSSESPSPKVSPNASDRRTRTLATSLEKVPGEMVQMKRRKRDEYLDLRLIGVTPVTPMRDVKDCSKSIVEALSAVSSVSSESRKRKRRSKRKVDSEHSIDEEEEEGYFKRKERKLSRKQKTALQG